MAELVLILIVVDNGLVLRIAKATVNGKECLNPYCSGQWSRTEWSMGVAAESERS